MIRGGFYYTAVAILVGGLPARAGDIPPECFQAPFAPGCPCAEFPDGAQCASLRCMNRDDCPTVYARVARKGGQDFDPPVARVEACAGDTVDVEFYARCWSNGDSVIPGTAPAMDGYQVQIDCASYFSGDAGNCAPRDFFTITDPGHVCCDAPPAFPPENNANFFVNTIHPRFAFADLEFVVARNTRICSYRGFAGLFRDQVPVTGFCPLEDAYDAYLVTVRLEVSSDAAGEFEICADDSNSPAVPGFDLTRFVTPTQSGGSSHIFPMAFECATIAVVCCGDGILQAGESCDDGNNVAGDGCSSACQLEFCGNNVVDPDEACDGTANSACEDLNCRPDCTCEEPTQAIPTVSAWGAIILSLILLATSKVYLGRRFSGS